MLEAGEGVERNYQEAARMCVRVLVVQCGPPGFCTIFSRQNSHRLTCAICLKLLCSTRYALAAAQGLAPAMFNLAAMHEPPPFPALTSPIYLNDANA